MLRLFAPNVLTVSLPLAAHARGSLLAWRSVPSLRCFSMKMATPTDRLELSKSRFATLEAIPGSKVAGTFPLHPPPNLDELLQRSNTGRSLCLFFTEKLPHSSFLRKHSFESYDEYPRCYENAVC